VDGAGAWTYVETGTGSTLVSSDRRHPCVVARDGDELGDGVEGDASGRTGNSSDLRGRQLAVHLLDDAPYLGEGDDGAGAAGEVSRAGSVPLSEELAHLRVGCSEADEGEVDGG
jgi:hypothetical protein